MTSSTHNPMPTRSRKIATFAVAGLLTLSAAIGTAAPASAASGAAIANAKCSATNTFIKTKSVSSGGGTVIHKASDGRSHTFAAASGTVTRQWFTQRAILASISAGATQITSFGYSCTSS